MTKIRQNKTKQNRPSYLLTEFLVLLLLPIPWSLMELCNKSQMYHEGAMGLPLRRRTPKLRILKLLQVLSNLLFPSGVQRRSLSFILCKQIFSWGRWQNSITRNVNFLSWRDKKGFIILWKGTHVSGGRRKKGSAYLPPLECRDQTGLQEKGRDIRCHYSMQMSVASVYRPSRNTKISREDWVTKTPIVLTDENFKREDLHDLDSIHNPISPNLVIGN